MKEFPKKINVKHINSFSSYLYDRELCYLRRDIYEHMIEHDENNYFNLDKLLSNRKLNSKKMITTIIEELEVLGWKCKTSFGGTGLFIYSTDNPPLLCYEDNM
jgi:hypothetical protein